MSETVTSTPDGKQLPIDDLAKAYGYTGTALTSITVVYAGGTYVKTYTYAMGQLTNESQWTKQ